MGVPSDMKVVKSVESDQNGMNNAPSPAMLSRTSSSARQLTLVTLDDSGAQLMPQRMRNTFQWAQDGQFRVTTRTHQVILH
jgi:hypothetical protein